MSHRSYSQVSSYLRCPKAFELSRVIRVPETPAWYLASGSAVHSCLEAIAKDPAVRGEALPSLWTDNFFEEIHVLEERSGITRHDWRVGGRKTKDKPDAENYTFWVGEGLRQIELFALWLDERIEEGWSIPTLGSNIGIEIELNSNFGTVPVKGYADLLMTTPTGELMVIDHKTGSRTPDTFQQLALYAFSMEKLGLPKPQLGAYFMTRKAELSNPTGFQDSDLASLTDIISNVDRAIKAEIFPAHPSSMCKSCGVASYCGAVNGAQSLEFDSIYKTKEEVK